ncbi:glycosyl transferase [Lipomyces oligophaga]|uniref:glycosyl transferase n=1 Tax=Lipomyces oligophaga TaxID=45792 RepID=UPI0034CE32EA
MSWKLLPALRYAVVASVCFKVLLFPAYTSTDFEVHRNWLAITHSLPFRQWYFEDLSEWTLDYPPFFAYFEWLLSQAARYLDPEMVEVSNLLYRSSQTIYFQRSSVIVSEFVLVYGLQSFISSIPEPNRQSAYGIAMSIYFSPGFLIVDNIHFQYNSMLFGLLIFSIVRIKQRRPLSAATFFAVLLCFKHIFLYLAPAYFFYLLIVFCLNINSHSLISVIRWKNCILLVTTLVVIFSLAFGPFFYLGQIDQLFSRLFPFSRGLCHAYWAPNVWALYSAADRALFMVFRKFLNLSVENASLTRGLVEVGTFSILPNVSPNVTFALTLLFQLLSMIPLIKNPTFEKFICALTLCGYSSFLFGWHVHEKAILLVIIPFSFVVLNDRRYLNPFFCLAISGYISLFPLLFTSAEAFIKYLYTFAWIFVFYNVFRDLATVKTSKRVFLLDRIAAIYLLGFLPLLCFVAIYDRIPVLKDLEFLRLMLMSTYCSFGVLGSFIGLEWLHLFT